MADPAPLSERAALYDQLAAQYGAALERRGVPMSRTEVQTKAALFDARIQTENRLGLIAFVVIILANALQVAFGSNSIERIGEGLTVAAAVYVIIRGLRAKRIARDGARRGEVNSLTYYRAELTRRRDEIGRFWLRYALPFVPGIVLSINGRADTPRSISQYAALVVGLLVLVMGVAWVNRREAKKLQEELDSLDSA